MARYGRDYNRGTWGGYYGHPRYFGGGYRSGYPEQPTYGYRADGYGYDRSLYSRPAGAYDRNYKSRVETNYGDPYGDRVEHTPIRMIRGEFDNRYAEPNRWRGYDRGNYGSYSDRSPYYNDQRGW